MFSFALLGEPSALEWGAARSFSVPRQLATECRMCMHEVHIILEVFYSHNDHCKNENAVFWPPNLASTSLQSELR